MHNVKMEAEIGIMCYKPETPQTTGTYQELGKSKEGFFPSAFRGSTALPTSSFQNSRLQNRDGVNFCCFKRHSLWKFVIAALGK